MIASPPRTVRERDRMVEEQLVARGVTDPRVLEAMRRVPRHLFVEEALRDRAYGDHPLPIGFGQAISQPFMVGRMTELLQLRRVGEGARDRNRERLSSGGARGAGWPRLHHRAHPEAGGACSRSAGGLGYSNVWVRVANGTLGWPDEAPFDRILVTAGGPHVPPPLFEQLAEGGSMVMPVGESATQVLQVIEKRGGEMHTTEHAGCVFVKLVGKYAWDD